MNRHRKIEYPEIMLAQLHRQGKRMWGKKDFTYPIESTGRLIGAIYGKMGRTVTTDATKIQVFSQYKWCENDKPIYRLTEDLTMALANTEPPMDTFDLDPKACVPLSGMYVALPPVFLIGNPQDNKAYAVEGIYIVEDLIPKEWDAPDPAATQVPGISFLGVGEDLAKGAWLGRTEGPSRDDTLIHFGVIQGKDIRPMVKGLSYPTDPKGVSKLMGVPELTKLAINLLWMLQYVPHAISRTVLPDGELKGKKDRARRREIARMNQKGRTHKGYLLMDLSTEQRKASTEASVSSTTVRAHIVRGHIHNYWMNDPKDKKPIEVKVVGDTTKYLVPKWVLPYRKGA
jgi:hypothetical protein